MVTIRDGYIVHKIATVKSHGRWSQRDRKYKNWFRGYMNASGGCSIVFTRLTLPKEYHGKKLRFKVEVIDEQKGDCAVIESERRRGRGK